MSHRTYALAAGTVFLLFTLAPLLRIGLRWPVSINGLSIPFWESGAMALLNAYMAYQGLRLARKAS
ncbi:MAG TPA: hypothetical protein VEG08_09275 [Terriglobales bacterium]|nr:hypothetical protein [Terriglobales bacterium]